LEEKYWEEKVPTCSLNKGLEKTNNTWEHDAGEEVEKEELKWKHSIAPDQSAVT